MSAGAFHRSEDGGGPARYSASVVSDVRELAAELLACRSEATAREVRAAYRRAVKTARPDTGGVGGDWVARMQAARDLLLRTAAPDRRRRDRVPAGAPDAYLPLRRSTWLADSGPRHQVDLRL